MNTTTATTCEMCDAPATRSAWFGPACEHCWHFDRDHMTCQVCGRRGVGTTETDHGNACTEGPFSCAAQIDRRRRGFNPTTGWADR